MPARGWPCQRLRSGRIYTYLHILQRTLAPETKWCRLSRNNPWLEHLRQCSAEYHRRRAAEHASSAAEHRAAASATDPPAEEKPVRRRVVGKQPDAKAAAAPPRAKAKSKPMTEKDHKKLAKTVKDEGKKRAKKKAAEAAKKG